MTIVNRWSKFLIVGEDTYLHYSSVRYSTVQRLKRKKEHVPYCTVHALSFSSTSVQVDNTRSDDSNAHDTMLLNEPMEERTA